MSHFPFGTQLDRFFGASRSASSRKRRRSRSGLFLGMESLEDRALLATVTVDVVNFAFNPTPVTIHVGDTVHWVWQGDVHSTTSVAGSIESWDSGVHNTGFTFDHTFQDAGTYVYYCKIHGFDNGNGTAGGMAASIVVLANTPTLQSIAVTPANPTITKGATEQFTATGTLLRQLDREPDQPGDVGIGDARDGDDHQHRPGNRRCGGHVHHHGHDGERDGLDGHSRSLPRP